MDKIEIESQSRILSMDKDALATAEAVVLAVEMCRSVPLFGVPTAYASSFGLSPNPPCGRGSGIKKASVYSAIVTGRPFNWISR